METKVKVLIVGIVTLLCGLIMLLFLAPLKLAETMTDVYVSSFVFFGAIALVIGFNVTFIGFVEIAMDKESLRGSKRKIFSVALLVIAIGSFVPYLAWAFISPLYTPNWAFSVTTDKSTYELGEPVQITVILENLGSVAHSFTSVSSNPVVVVIHCTYTNIHNFTTQYPYWYSNAGWGAKTKIMIPPHQPLERTFIWNQTPMDSYSAYPVQAGSRGTVVAYIPLSTDVSTLFSDRSTFYAKTKITITSS